MLIERPKKGETFMTKEALAYLGQKARMFDKCADYRAIEAVAKIDDNMARLSNMPKLIESICKWYFSDDKKPLEVSNDFHLSALVILSWLETTLFIVRKGVIHTNSTEALPKLGLVLQHPLYAKSVGICLDKVIIASHFRLLRLLTELNPAKGKKFPVSLNLIIEQMAVDKKRILVAYSRTYYESLNETKTALWRIPPVKRRV